MMLQPLNNNTNRVQQRHLRLRKFDLLNKRHKPRQSLIRERHELLHPKLPVVGDVLELLAGRHAYDLVVERVVLVQEVLEYLIDQRP